MQDLVTLGKGNSRFLKSVENFKDLYPTYNDFVAALVAGTLPIDLNGINTDGIKQAGTPLNKETLLKDATAAKFGLDPNAVPDDVFAVLHDVIRDGNSNLHGQWMEKKVAPGISVKTGELVNLVDDVATRKMVATPVATEVNIDGNAGTSERFFCQLDENHLFGVYGSSLDTWVMEIGENGSISQIDNGWINASYSYTVNGAVRLNRNYVFVLQTNGATHYASLIHVDDAYQSTLAKRTSFSNSGYSSATLEAIVAGSETEVYLVYNMSAGTAVTQYRLVKFTCTLNGTSSTITRGTIYDLANIVPTGSYLYHEFKIYGVGNSRCLIAMNKDQDSSNTGDSYNDQTLLLFDMSGSTPVLIKSEDVFSSSSDAVYPPVTMNTIQLSEKEILGIYAPTKNEDGTYNYKIFKCIVDGDDFTISQQDSLVTADKIMFGHYDRNKKLMFPPFPTYSGGTKYPIYHFDVDTLELYKYVSDISAFYVDVRSDTSSYPTYTVWLEDSTLLRVFYQITSGAYYVDVQVMDFYFTASEYLAVSDADTGEMVKLGINGNFNMPSAVAGDFYELAERVNANAFMNGIMSFLPEPMKFATGSYYGTGYDTTNYNKVTITLDFVPKLLFVASDNGKVSAIIAPTGGVAFSPSSATEYYLYSVGATVSGTKITINAATGYLIVKQTCVSYTNTHSTLNGSGTKYNYFAFGV